LETKLRWAAVTGIAPVAWGTTYFVTRRYLPATHPLYGAAIRALPAGLLLLLISRTLPSGSWWWRSAVLGVLNMGAFFALVYVAAQLLPTSIASSVMATGPIVMMLFARALLSARLQRPHVLGAGLGIIGVWLMVFTGTTSADGRGVLASVGAMLMSSLGYVLAKRWTSAVDVLASTGWQLIAGGGLLVPIALAVEGDPPRLDSAALVAFGYVTVIATAGAFIAWFTGLRHLNAGTVGLIGLLNPVTGVLLGVVLGSETLTLRQVIGIALVFSGIVLGGTARAGVPSSAAPTPPRGETSRE
jgi:probable blue pigment (indigoidine) exporter